MRTFQSPLLRINGSVDDFVLLQFLLTMWRTRGEPLSTATVSDRVPREARERASASVTVLVRTDAMLYIPHTI